MKQAKTETHGNVKIVGGYGVLKKEMREVVDTFEADSRPVEITVLAPNAIEVKTGKGPEFDGLGGMVYQRANVTRIEHIPDDEGFDLVVSKITRVCYPLDAVDNAFQE